MELKTAALLVQLTDSRACSDASSVKEQYIVRTDEGDVLCGKAFAAMLMFPHMHWRLILVLIIAFILWH